MKNNNKATPNCNQIKTHKKLWRPIYVGSTIPEHKACLGVVDTPNVIPWEKMDFLSLSRYK